jgi:hypothetical protein
MRGARQVGFSATILKISSRMSLVTGLLPTRLRTRVIDSSNAGMVELGQRESFLAKTSAGILVDQQRGRNHLDGDITLQAFIPGTVHDTHSARAEGRDNFIPTELGARGESHSHGIIFRKKRVSAEATVLDV